jgi:hypothetical protein
LDDLIGQLEIIETLAEFRELLFLSAPQLFFRLLVVAEARLTFREERTDR